MSSELTNDDWDLLESAGYSRKVINLYRNHVNVGPIKNATVTLTNAGSYGESMDLYLKINRENVIEDAKFQYVGCIVLAACGSALTQLIREKTLQEAKKISADDLLRELEGLPDGEDHCALLAIKTLKKIIKKYEKKRRDIPQERHQMIISIASGKGGTGKTSVAVNMALSLGNIQLLDCDVEEPNAHLLLRPTIYETNSVYTTIPAILEGRCNYCRKCAEFCTFNAIFVASKSIIVFPELCHSCGGCFIICSQKAIEEGKKLIGTIKKGRSNTIELVYGELTVGEPMPVPLIREVKKEKKKYDVVLIDAPPGTACPLVVSVYQSDYCILVTEPTPFGLHDLKITIQVLRDLEIPLGVIVNRAGIGNKEIYDYCKEEKIPVLLEIPFSTKIAELYSRGTPFVKEMPEWKEKFRDVLNQIIGFV